jgi:hypothetical protein
MSDVSRTPHADQLAELRGWILKLAQVVEEQTLAGEARMDDLERRLATVEAALATGARATGSS